MAKYVQEQLDISIGEIFYNFFYFNQAIAMHTVIASKNVANNFYRYLQEIYWKM